MSVSLTGCYFAHTKLSIHFKSFNDNCAIVNEAKRRKPFEAGIKTNAC